MVRNAERQGTGIENRRLYCGLVTNDSDERKLTQSAIYSVFPRLTRSVQIQLIQREL